MDPTKGEHSGEHASIFPIQLFFLPGLNESLNQAVRNDFSGVHSVLDSVYHGSVNLNQIIVQFSTAVTS